MNTTTPAQFQDFVTEAEVHAACEELDRDGQEPSSTLIRARLGNRGSKSTIVKYRKSWDAKRAVGQAVDAVPEMPEELRRAAFEAIGRVWADACTLASVRAAEANAAHSKRIADLEQSEVDSEAFVAALERENSVLRQQVSTLEAAASELSAEMQAAAARQAGLEGELRGLRAAFSLLTAPVDTGVEAVAPAGEPDAAGPKPAAREEPDPSTQPIALRRAPAPAPVTSRPPSAASA